MLHLGVRLYYAGIYQCLFTQRPSREEGGRRKGLAGWAGAKIEVFDDGHNEAARAARVFGPFGCGPVLKGVTNAVILREERLGEICS